MRRKKASFFPCSLPSSIVSCYCEFNELFIVELIFGAGTRIRWRKPQHKRDSLRREVTMMDNEEQSDEKQRLPKEIDKEIDKVKHFMEEIDELVEIQDYSDMELVNKRAVKIIIKLSDLILQTEELNIERGSSHRTVRQWRKDIKSKYAASVSENETLKKCLDEREEEIPQRKDLKPEQRWEDQRRFTCHVKNDRNASVSLERTP